MSRLHQAIEKAAKMREPVTVPLVDESRPVDRNGIGMAALTEVEPLTVSHPHLAAWNDKDRAAREEYGKLRSLVLRLTEGETFRNTLMVTSTVSGEGKTLTALNLALALAQDYDHSVLLVDADLRRPAVHQYLDLEAGVGLVDCLLDDLPLERALVKTGLGKLVVLPAGDPVEDPVDLLASARMKSIVRDLKSRYPERYIIFDTPPVLPFADAQVLGQAVDGILFVVRENGPSPDEIREALNSLKATNLLGAVYNNADTFLRRERNEYYGYYR